MKRLFLGTAMFVLTAACAAVALADVIVNMRMQTDGWYIDAAAFAMDCYYGAIGTRFAWMYELKGPAGLQ